MAHQANTKSCSIKSESWFLRIWYLASRSNNQSSTAARFRGLFLPPGHEMLSAFRAVAKLETNFSPGPLWKINESRESENVESCFCCFFLRWLPNDVSDEKPLKPPEKCKVVVRKGFLTCRWTKVSGKRVEPESPQNSPITALEMGNKLGVSWLIMIDYRWMICPWTNSRR